MKWAALLIGVAALGGVAGVVSVTPTLPPLGSEAIQRPAPSRHFILCHSGGGTNCVVDGDTIWMDGVKIRVADIDAPETHPPRCQRERELGRKATARLQEILNAGPFVAETQGRAQDRYGRQLRVLVRGGGSLGAALVSEGLARPWDGGRHPWC
jgi:endonuclease YncB( thermonuclease family)